MIWHKIPFIGITLFISNDECGLVYKIIIKIWGTIKDIFFNNWKEDNNKNDGCKGCTGYLQGNGKRITSNNEVYW